MTMIMSTRFDKIAFVIMLKVSFKLNVTNKGVLAALISDEVN